MWFARGMRSPALRPGPRVLVLLAIGAAAGMLSGMFGIGGGVVLVPLLVAAGLDHRRAAATSLLAILPSAIAGSITYLAQGQVDFIAAAVIAVGAIVGSFIGSHLLKRLPLAWLRWLFIGMVALVAVRMFLIVPVRGDALEISPLLVLGYLALGLVMGIAAGMFGIGGGIIAVPALVAIAGVSDLIAKGTSLLVIVPTSISGTVANLRHGFVDLRAGIIVGLAASGGSVLGAFIALGMPPQLSSVLFGVLASAIVVQLVVREVVRMRRRDRGATDE